MMESPLNVAHMEPRNLINWTITYRGDSDIIEPYGYWVSNEKLGKKNTVSTRIKDINITAKTKKVNGN